MSLVKTPIIADLFPVLRYPLPQKEQVELALSHGAIFCAYPPSFLHYSSNDVLWCETISLYFDYLVFALLFFPQLHRGRKASDTLSFSGHGT